MRTSLGSITRRLKPLYSDNAARLNGRSSNTLGCQAVQEKPVSHVNWLLFSSSGHNGRRRRQPGLAQPRPQINNLSSSLPW